MSSRESKTQSSQHLLSNRSAVTLVVSPLATKERAEKTELSNQQQEQQQQDTDRLLEDVISSNTGNEHYGDKIRIFARCIGGGGAHEMVDLQLMTQSL